LNHDQVIYVHPCKRLPIELRPDSSRVITRFFGPGDENRIRDIIARVLAIPEAAVVTLLANLERDFGPIHANIDDVFRENYATVKHHVVNHGAVSEVRRRFIGACFTMEYAIESAALFNPSMVPAIDQSNVQPGSIRFLMSLRATGEGHLSSIVFRKGLVDSDGSVTVDPPGRYSRQLRANTPDDFEKAEFARQLRALDAWTKQAETTLSLLGSRFTRADLSNAIDETRKQAVVSGVSEECHDTLLTLTQANYRIPLSSGLDISEVVIFPYSDNERRGIEDLRLVHFTGDDGSVHYYGTYTAYNGFRIFPHLLEYPVGQNVGVQMLTGRCAKNKGMALFPRRIGGRAQWSPGDNENLYYMESDDVRVWDEARLLRSPAIPMGGNSNRQLRPADRDRRGLAALDPRRWSDAPILHWRHPARPGQPLPGDRRNQRADTRPNWKGEIWLCPERRLLLRRNDPCGQVDTSLRDERRREQYRGHRPAGVAGFRRTAAGLRMIEQ
jgi:hypothetical protein